MHIAIIYILRGDNSLVSFMNIYYPQYKQMGKWILRIIMTLVFLALGNIRDILPSATYTYLREKSTKTSCRITKCSAMKNIRAENHLRFLISSPFIFPLLLPSALVVVFYPQLDSHTSLQCIAFVIIPLLSFNHFLS